MLNKNNRISNRHLIRKLFDKGRLYKNVEFIFKFLPATEKNSKFAIIISKKIASKATDRNNLKRQISEIIRLNLNLLKINIVGLIIAKNGIIKNNQYNNIESGILDFFNKLNLHE